MSQTTELASKAIDVQQSTLENSQQALEQAMEIPVEQTLQLQKSAAQLFLNGLEMGTWAGNRGIDMTRDAFTSYIDTVEEAVEDSTRLAERNLEEVTDRQQQFLQRQQRSIANGAQQMHQQSRQEPMQQRPVQQPQYQQQPVQEPTRQQPTQQQPTQQQPQYQQQSPQQQPQYQQQSRQYQQPSQHQPQPMPQQPMEHQPAQQQPPQHQQQPIQQAPQQQADVPAYQPPAGRPQQDAIGDQPMGYQQPPGQQTRMSAFQGEEAAPSQQEQPTEDESRRTEVAQENV